MPVDSLCWETSAEPQSQRGHFLAPAPLGLFAEEGQERVIKLLPLHSGHGLFFFFFSEKKRHHQPRSLSFGNCGWEGPLWLGRQSGQSDSPFPESQAGTRRLKEERHQAELDCLLLWTVRQGGRLNCFAAVHFFPFSLPCLLSLHPPSWLRRQPQLQPLETSPAQGQSVSGLILSIFTLFPPAQQQIGAESTKEKNWCNPVVCCGFFSGLVGALVCGSCQDRGRAAPGLVSWYQERCHQQQGLASCLSRQTRRAFQGAPPVMWHSLQQDLQDIWGLPLPSRSSPSLAVWLSAGAGLVMVKEPQHQNGLGMIIQGKKKEVHSFEPWRTLRVLQPTKTAQARLADLHVSLIIPNCLNLVFVQETKFVFLIALTAGFKNLRGVSVVEQ